MKERKVLVYEASDGKKFFSKEDCLEYEELLAFQDNFGELLKSSGISQEAFGSMVGLSRQQINNLVHKRVKMSKTQYIAFNVVLGYIKADSVERKATKEEKSC